MSTTALAKLPAATLVAAGLASATAGNAVQSIAIPGAAIRSTAMDGGQIAREPPAQSWLERHGAQPATQFSGR